MTRANAQDPAAEIPAAPAVAEALSETAAVDAAPEAAPEPAPVAAAETPDASAVAYMQKCMGCHSIGGGALSGPDLKNSAGYPRQTVVDAVKRMEKNVGPLSDTDVASLTDFLLDPKAGERLQAYQQMAAMQEAASLEPPNAAIGRDLFLGSRGFQNRGLACAACHQAGGRGGNLAASLEDSFTRLGEPSLMATSQSPGFPVMRAIYADRTVTKQEAMHLTKFLEEISAEPAPPANVPLHVAGVAGTVAVMLLLGGATHKRAAGTRKRMVAEAQRRTNRRGDSRRDR
jgi:mono/diheme cytochrome c family protein